MRAIDQTLLEQMRIDDLEIARRKTLLGFSQQDADLLTWCKPLVKDGLNSLVLDFYERQTSIDEIALIIGDSDTLDRLQVSMEKYVGDLFDGCYDSAYVSNRLRIGLVHRRIGVSPSLYLASVYELEKSLRRILCDKIADPEMQARVVDSLNKILCFDTALVFDTYIRGLLMEVEDAKDKVERYAKILEDKVTERTTQLKALSHQDSLTGLNNRRALREVLRRDLIRAERTQSVLSLVYFDVDHFKEINDSFGHQRGDEILTAVAQALRDVSREMDILCRVGGDEFCVVLGSCNAEQAEIYCKRFLAKLCEKEPDIELSVGIVQSGPELHEEPDRLLSRADELMYRAKKTPGSHIVR